MKPYIIVITGASGTGKTTFALEFAKTMGIGSIISTDFLREVLKKQFPKKKYKLLEKSSYLAGQTKNYHKLKDSEKKKSIIKAYKLQCELIYPSVEAILSRAIKENIPVVVEGTHILPGMLKKSYLYPELKKRFREYVIFINDEEVHKQRFIKRSSQAPERQKNKYLDNLKEIRWIQEHIINEAKKYNNITLIENSKEFPMDKYVRIEPKIVRQKLF